MNLQLKGRGAVDKLLRTLQQEAVTATFTNITTVYDPITQTQVRDETSITLQVYKSSFEDKEEDGVTVSRDDIKIIGRNWLMGGFEVTEDTECVIDGQYYNIINVKVKMLSQLLWVHLRA